MIIGLINEQIKVLKENGNFNAKKISDGYHTFEELYEFRKMYNAALFNEWGVLKPTGNILTSYPAQIEEKVKYNVHKSKRHYDGELCFGGTHFKVSAMLPSGEISNHYKLEDWDLFKIPETEKALFESDGHTGEDTLKRLRSIL